MLQDPAGHVGAGGRLEAAEARVAVGLAHPVAVTVEQQVDAGDLQPQGLGAVARQHVDCLIHREVLALAAPGDVGLEAAVHAAAQHRPHHPAADHPHPQVLAWSLADVLLQDQRLAGIEAGHQFHQIAEALPVTAQVDAFAIGAGQHLHHAGKADLPFHQLAVHRKAHQHRARDRQVDLGQQLLAVELVLHRFDRPAGVDHRHAQVLELAQDRQAEVAGAAAGAGQESVGQLHLLPPQPDRAPAAPGHDQVDLIG